MKTTEVHPLARQLHRAFDGGRADFNRLVNEINDALFGQQPSSSSQDTPSWVAPIQRRLDQIERTLSMVSQNTAKVAADWPQVQAAITSKLQADADQIKSLMAERDALKAEEATDGLSADEEAKLGEVDKQMNDLLNNLHGVVAQQPAPSTGTGTTAGASAGTDANTAQGTHDTTSAGAQAAGSGAAATGGPSAGAGTNADISGGVAGDTSGAKSA